MKHLIFLLLPLGVLGQPNKAQSVRDRDYSMYLLHYTRMASATEEYRVASNFNEKKMGMVPNV